MVINKKIVQFFSCLADETRLKILLALSGEAKSVGEIHEIIGKDSVTLSAISHQLRLLSNLDIVISEKDGRTKMFKRSNDFCWCILNNAFKHFNRKSNKALNKFNLER